MTFYVGWSGDASADTPDLLDVTIDKTNYKPGEDLKLNIASRFAGKATVAILSEKLEYLTTFDLQTGDNHATIPVGNNWGTGAYVVALAHRPLDKAANRMPGRALGLAWFGLDEAGHKIGVSLAAPQKVTPRGPLTIPVELKGLASGEEAYVTLAAVDIGILNLTHYETPDPYAYFDGQKQLSAEIRDLYGLLIDGMQGTRGAIRSGGDGAGAMEGNRPTQEPLARYSGVVKVGADGKAQITFDLPAFNGSVRLMAAAWSKGKVGNASQDVIVRDNVVMQATVPRFLALGDRSQFHLQLDNVEGKPGDYTLDLDLHGPLTIGADSLHKTIKLDAGARAAIDIPRDGGGRRAGRCRCQADGPRPRCAAEPRLQSGARHVAALSPRGPNARVRRKASRSATISSPMSCPAPVRCRSRSRLSQGSTCRRFCRRSTVILMAVRNRRSAAPCPSSMSIRSRAPRRWPSMRA